MYIKSIIVTPEGDYEFNGSLTQEQLMWLVEIGLAVVLDEGGMPFATLDNAAQMSFDFSEEQH